MRFREARVDRPIELEAHQKLIPPRGTTKGMFFNHLLDQVAKAAPDASVAALAGVEPRRYVAFLDYPYADLQRMMVAALPLVHPGDAPGLALRKMGRRVYPMFLESHVGRVVFGVLGNDLETILSTAPRGYSLTSDFGRVTSERVRDQCWYVRFSSYPAFLETYQAGVIEGAFQHYGVTPRIRVDLQDLGTATFEVAWDRLA